MATKLVAKKVTSTDVTLVQVIGAIDVDLREVQPFSGASTYLVIDMGGIDRITSFGVREWITALSNVHSEYIGFINCRPIVVAQFNSVADFGRDGEIVSLYLPYVCSGCGAEFEDLIDLRERFSMVESDDVPHQKCPKCGADGEFDDLPENYFSFVRHQGKPRVPEAAARVIAGKLDAAPQSFRVEKEVDMAVTGLWLFGTLDARARLRRIFDGVEGDAVIEFSGLSSIDADGAANLCAALGPDLHPYLARPSLSTLQVLVPGRVQQLAGRLVSLLLDGDCAKCGARRRGEVAGGDLARFLDGKLSLPRCEICGDVLDVRVEPAARELAAAVFGPAPANVERYLERRPLGQKREAKFRIHSAYKGNAGSYEILHSLGRGGMAEVFLARQRGIQGFEKRVVLKRILKPFIERDEFVQMFLQEARVAARISHPNVVQIFDLAGC